MAPYTMPVILDNQTPYSLDFKTWGSYPVDGSPEGSGKAVNPKSTGQGAYFTKGGGTDGLFSGALFSISGASRDIFIYCSMPATGGAHVSVRCALSTTDQGIQDLVNKAQNSGYGSSHVEDVLVINNETVLLKLDCVEARDSYPDSTCKFSVQAFKKL